MSARRGSLTKPCDIIFKEADFDGDNMLNLNEFREVLHHLRNALPVDEAAELAEFLAEVPNMADSEVQEIFDDINTSKTGLITLSEFRSCEFFEEDD